MSEIDPKTPYGRENDDDELPGSTCSDEEVEESLIPGETLMLSFPRTTKTLTHEPCRFPRTRRPSRKGLKNPPKAFNCFLNAVIQSLWHLDHFKSIFISIDRHGSGTLNSLHTRHEYNEMASVSHKLDFSSLNELVERKNCLTNVHQEKCRGIVALEENTIPTCVYCALRWIFERFQYDDDAYDLPSDGMRVALAILGERNKRFQLKSMEDAAECFEMIMDQLHQDVCGTHVVASKTPGFDRFSCQHMNCPAHVVFGYEIFDERYCKCHVPRSTGKIHSSCIYYLSTSKLVNRSKEEIGDVGSNLSKISGIFSASSHTSDLSSTKKGSGFFDFIRKPWKRSDSSGVFEQSASKLSTSPSILKQADLFERAVKSQHVQSSELFFGSEMHCRKVIDVRRILIRSPKVFVMSFVWDSVENHHKDTELVWKLLSPILDLRRIFEVVSSEYNEMYLQSIICYFGLHYVSYCLSISSSTWLMFDDDKVCEIGREFQDLVEHCIRRRERPYLLFYSSFNTPNQQDLMEPLSHEDWEVLERQQRLRIMLSKDSNEFQKRNSSDSGCLSTLEDASDSLKLSTSSSFLKLSDCSLNLPHLVHSSRDFDSP